MRLLDAEMQMARQIGVVCALTLAGVRYRVWGSSVIVLSIACVVGVLMAMLSATEGLLRSYQDGGRADQAIVMSAEVPSEYGTSLSRSDIATIINAPGIARGAGGRLAADAEILFWVPPTEGYRIGSPHLRGVGPAGLSLYSGFKIVSGRLFDRGRQELIIGVRAQRAFGLKIGDTLIMRNGQWPIVGIFSAGGGLLEGQLVGDAETVMSESGITGYGSVLVRLQTVRAFDAFQRWLTDNPNLAVSVERQSEYYLRTATGYSSFFTKIAYLVGAIMAVGALSGAVKIMYGAVSARTREIATLLAIGYGPLAVGIAVVFEMMVLSVTGALIGGALAWLIFNGQSRSDIHNVFDLNVSPQLFGLGIAWAVVLAMMAGGPPAIRAARLSVKDALREV